jgi:hypothetical protein
MTSEIMREQEKGNQNNQEIDNKPKKQEKGRERKRMKRLGWTNKETGKAIRKIWNCFTPCQLRTQN